MLNTLPLQNVCCDAATSNCPCVAAITRDCPVCNLLNHGQQCGCNQTWPGLCIYEKYLQQDIKPVVINEDQIVVAQKFNLNNYITLICTVPSKQISSFKPFQIVNITINHYNHSVKLFAVITKVLKDKNLLTLAVKDTENEAPIKYGFILQKGSNVELKVTGNAIPPLFRENMKKVLISVDGFWQSLLHPLIDILKKAEKEVIITGPLSLKATSQLSLTLADKVVPTEKFGQLTEEIRNSCGDTLITLNTPLWQRKIITFLWTEKININLICVNNQ